MKLGMIAMGVGLVVLAAAAIVFGVMWGGARSEIASKNAEVSRFEAKIEAERERTGHFDHAGRALAASLGSLMSSGATITVNLGTQGPITITKDGENKLSVSFSSPYPSFYFHESEPFRRSVTKSVYFDLADMNKVDMGELSGIAEKSVLRQAIGQFALAYMAGNDEWLWNNPDYIRLWDAMLGKETTLGFEYDAAEGTGALKIPIGKRAYQYFFSTRSRDYVLKVFDSEGTVMLEFSSKEEFSSGELPQ